MKNVIVGTAGHVDHGKTELIKALSGIDTDRLKEEKKRGITIELGFANLKNDKDINIGIIDVPGHEKFIKNMLSGVGGIDLVLLIIALDEGIKPQTEEHFKILNNIGIKNGIIVFTKKDLLINEDRYKEINEDVDKLVKGSFLEGKKRIAVSSYTLEGIEELKKLIYEEVKNIEEKKTDKEVTRLNVDRVFTMEGFGTVVTGTLIEGNIETKDTLTLYPEEIEVRVRQLENHGNIVDKVLAGERTAINLLNVKKEDIKRGDVLAYPNSFILSKVILCDLTLFSNDINIKNGSIVNFNFGSRHENAKINIVDNKNDLIVYFTFEKPIPIKRNDRYIIRNVTQNFTIGGGRVLLVNTERKKYEEIKDCINILKSDDIKKNVYFILNNKNKSIFNKIDLSNVLNLTYKETENALNELNKENKIIIKNDIVLSYDIYEKLKLNIKNKLEDFHKLNPVLSGMNKEQFKSYLNNIFIEADNKKVDIVYEILINDNVIKENDNAISINSFKKNVNDKNKKIMDEIESIYKEAKYEVPIDIDVLNRYKDTKLARQILNDLVIEHKLIKLAKDYYMHVDTVNAALKTLYKYFEKEKTLKMADFRTMINSSRKYTILLLDFFDIKKITKTTDDVRILLKKDFYF